MPPGSALSRLFEEELGFSFTKTELKQIRKENREAVDKIKRLKTAQLIKYKKERDVAILKLNQEKKNNTK